MNNFNNLITTLKVLHDSLQQSAVNAVNQSLTIRNWLIGFYIVEYEQNGKDRAEYGTDLLKNIAKKLNIKGLTAPELSRCRQFYNTYPQIIGTLSQISQNSLPSSILGTLSQKSIQIKNKTTVPVTKLVTSLSFSHFVELIKIEDDTKRTFYEIQAIKGVWSARELRRQINSLFYERSALSKNYEKLIEIEQKKLLIINHAM